MTRLAAPATLVCAALVCAATALSPAALAQTPAPTPTPAPPSEGLPSLTPRVFTSTGPTRVALPSIERQPLTGFGPPPRTYVVPAEREPVVEPFEPPVEALPPLAIAGPAEPTVRVRPGRSLRAEAAFGSLYTRSGRIDLQATGEAGVFFVDADLDGQSPSSEYVRADRLAVRAGGQSFAAGRIRIEGVVAADSYTLPGAATAERRRRLAAGTTVGVSGVGGVPYDLRVGYTQSRLGLADGTDETNEGRVDAEARLGLGRNRVRLDAAGGVAGTGAAFGAGLGDVAYASGGLAVAFERTSGGRLVVGARGLLVRATDAGGTDTQYVGPVVDVRVPLSPTSALFVVNAPRLEVRSLAALAALNPYVAAGAVVAPDVFPVDAQGGVEIGEGATRVRFYGLATYSPSRIIFARGGGGLFTEDYVGATTAGLGADLALGSADRVSVSAGVEVRAARVRGGGDLPFYAPLVGRAGLQAPFAGGRGRIGLHALVESARPDGQTGDTTAPAFGLVGLDARFDVGGPLALVARAERLVGAVERWPGFPEAPFTAVLGLRLTR